MVARLHHHLQSSPTGHGSGSASNPRTARHYSLEYCKSSFLAFLAHAMDGTTGPAKYTRRSGFKFGRRDIFKPSATTRYLFGLTGAGCCVTVGPAPQRLFHCSDRANFRDLFLHHSGSFVRGYEGPGHNNSSGFMALRRRHAGSKTKRRDQQLYVSVM